MLDNKIVFLVVDDLEAMRKITSAQLRSLGACNIVTANNGSEALRLLQKQRVDIVLSDWNMPLMSGLQLLQAVRADARLARLPFIMITAEAERERIEEAIGSGVNDLLVKPYTADGLATRIDRVLNGSPRSASTLLAIPTARRSELLPPAGDESRAGAAPEQVRATILVVDDTPDNLHVLFQLFQDDYRIRTALTGEKALEICQSNDPPDLVLLDIMMPGMDGFEVARRMREHPTSETIPVIFVTAMTGGDARLRGLELGAVDFVTKPIDAAVLKPRVRNFLRYVELHKQLQATYDGMLEVAQLREDVERITRHDMKGPLAGVIGLVQSLANEDSMNHRHVEQLRMVEEAALQVLNLINLSSELFKIESGRFKLDAKPVRIAEILQRIAGISQATFAEKQLSIIVDAGLPDGVEIPLVSGDAMFCYSLFQNLIKNACEAAPESSLISISVSDQAPLHITIRNQGAVPAEMRECFFDKFSTSGKQGGTGLGTYSARLLTEAQAGSISLQVCGEEDQTAITVTLPRYSAGHRVG